MKNFYPHPPSEKFFELSTLYYQLHSTFSKGSVVMTSVHIPADDDADKCGTPACFAGWFCVGRQTFLNKKDTSLFSYHVYADHIAKFIFPKQNWDRYHLCAWAGQNEKIWGNDCGAFMFSTAEAFDVSDEEINLEKIATHLKKVGQRLWEIELEENKKKASNFIIQLKSDLNTPSHTEGVIDHKTDLITTDEVK